MSDSFETGMDIISEVPIEIAEKILEELCGQELWECLSVCRSWRLIANQEHLWKPHTIQNSHEQTPNPPGSGDVRKDFRLCYRAAQWADRKRIVSMWKSCKFAFLNWPKHNDPKVYSIYKNRLAVRTQSKIHIYIIKDEGTLKVDTINLPWNCFFEFRLMEMNSKHIIIGFNNVIIVYELDNTYTIKIAYTFNGDAAMATSCIHNFIDNGRNTYFVNILRIVRLAEESVWIKVKYMYFHATYFHINLTDGSVTNVFPFRNVKYACSSDDVLIFREGENEVLILEAKGATLLRKLKVGLHFSLTVNNRMLSITTNQGLSTFEISTGNNLANIYTPKYSKYTAVNPVFDIVYCIHEDSESRKDVFSSFEMRSGTKLWSRVLQEKIPEFFRLNAVTISILYGALIIIKTGGTDPPYLDDEHVQHKREYFVFDASTGELLYRNHYEKFLLVSELYLCDNKYLRSII